MVALPVPSPLMKSPPWIMKSLICDKNQSVRLGLMSFWVTYNTVEFAALVALRPALVVFGLAGAELAEILCCFGRGPCEELHFHAAEGLSCRYMFSCCLASIDSGGMYPCDIARMTCG